MEWFFLYLDDQSGFNVKAKCYEDAEKWKAAHYATLEEREPKTIGYCKQDGTLVFFNQPVNNIYLSSAPITPSVLMPNINIINQCCCNKFDGPLWTDVDRLEWTGPVENQS